MNTVTEKKIFLIVRYFITIKKYFAQCFHFVSIMSFTDLKHFTSIVSSARLNHFTSIVSLARLNHFTSIVNLCFIIYLYFRVVSDTSSEIVTVNSTTSIFLITNTFCVIFIKWSIIINIKSYTISRRLWIDKLMMKFIKKILNDFLNIDKKFNCL